MTSVAGTARVRAEMQRFRARLPDLLGSMPGRWVVFRDGEVVSQHDDETDAVTTALRRFGADGGFIVARVEVEHAEPLTAAQMFGVR